MNYFDLVSFPAFILLFSFFWEAARFVVARKCRSGCLPVLTLVSWTVRPWAVWAALNLVYRFYREKAFNNHLTFPFYANLWWSDEIWRNLVGQAMSFSNFQIWVVLTLVVAGLLFLLLRFSFLSKEPTRRRVVLTLVAAFFLSAVLHIVVNNLPGMVPMGRNEVVKSVDYPWCSQGTTMRHAALMVTNTVSYISNFVQLQPGMERIIHAASHPPGASLSLYWIGLIAGMGDMPGAVGFMAGLTFFSALSLPVIFLLAKQITGSSKTGLVAALIWSVMPSTVIYNTFAQDGLYAVFFNLLLLFIWRLTIEEKPDFKVCLTAGILFFCGAMLNYSVCLPAGIFFVFILVTGLGKKWGIGQYLYRFVLPGSIGLALLLLAMAVFRLDYMKMYLTAKGFVDKFYEYDGLYQAIVALIGGQIDLFLMMGAVICSGFIVYLAGLRRTDSRKPDVRFLLIILGVYLIAVFFGPNCLRMETSRCWNWVLTVPMILSVKMLGDREYGWLLLSGAWLVSLVSSFFMRLFMNFGC